VTLARVLRRVDALAAKASTSDDPEPLAWLAADSDPLTRTDGRDWRAPGDGARVEPGAHRASMVARARAQAQRSVLLLVCGAWLD